MGRWTTRIKCLQLWLRINNSNSSKIKCTSKVHLTEEIEESTSAKITTDQGVTPPIGKAATKEEVVETKDAHPDTTTETSTLVVHLVTTVVIAATATTEPMIDPLIADTTIPDAMAARTPAENLGRILITVTQDSMLRATMRAGAGLKITAAITQTAVAGAAAVVGAWTVEPATTTDHTHTPHKQCHSVELQTDNTKNNK